MATNITLTDNNYSISSNLSFFSSLETVCPDLSAEFWTVRDGVYLFAYYILPPVYFVLGMTGHLVSVTAFYRESKKSPPYVYQTLVMASETAKIISITLLFLCYRWWSGITGSGADWYMKNYWLMYYAAHISFPLPNAISIATLLLSVAMAGDRLTSIWSPLTYSKINHRLYQKLAVVISFVIGFLVCIFDVFRYQLVYVEPYYKVRTDDEYMNLKSTIFLTQLRNFVQASGLAALIGCNVGAMWAFYRLIANQQTSISNLMTDRRLADRKRAEKTLLFLTLSQSIFTSIDRIFLISYMVMVYVKPTTFLQCEGRLVAPLCDATDEICTIANFYIALWVSKPFRRLVIRTLPFGIKQVFQTMAVTKTVVQVIQTR